MDQTALPLQSEEGEDQRKMLSATEQQSVVKFLGWPSKTLQVDSTHYSKIFVDRLTSLDAEGEVIVRDYLRKLGEIDEKIECATCRVSTEQVDNITLNNREIEQLYKLRRRWICELSDFLDLPILKTCNHVGSVIV